MEESWQAKSSAVSKEIGLSLFIIYIHLRPPIRMKRIPLRSVSIQFSSHETVRLPSLSKSLVWLPLDTYVQDISTYRTLNVLMALFYQITRTCTRTPNSALISDQICRSSLSSPLTSLSVDDTLFFRLREIHSEEEKTSKHLTDTLPQYG